MAEAGVFETFGFLFTAKDLASAVIEKTDAGIAAAAVGVNGSLKMIAKTIEVTGGLAGKLLMKTIGSPFKSVFGEVAQLGIKTTVKLFTTTMKTVKTTAEDALVGTIHRFMSSASAVFSFPDKVKKSFSNLAFHAENLWDTIYVKTGKATEKVESFVKFMFTKNFTWQGIFTATKDKLSGFWTKLRTDGALTAVTLKKGILNTWTAFTDSVLKNGGKVKDGLGAVFGALKGGAFAGLGKLGGVVKGLGSGLMSAFSGPIGIVLKLLEPLIDMFKRSFEPALETISILVENAFAPFAGLLDTIAQSLQPIISKMLTPLVGIMEMLAVQAGVFLQKLLPVEGAIDPVASIFEMIAPLADQIASAVGDFASEIAGTLFDTLKQTGPIIVKSLLELTKALLPLLPHVLKLGAALAKYVFAPLLIKSIEGLGLIIEHVIVPAVKWLVENLGPWLDDVTTQVVDFYSNFGKNMNDFYILFIEPVVTFFTDDIPDFFTKTLPNAFTSGITFIQDGLVGIVSFAKDKIGGLLTALGFDTLATKVGSVFDAVIKAVHAPIETMKGIINEYIVGSLNSIIQWKVPVVGDPLSKILGLKEIPKLATGGIAGLGGRSAIAEVGEAGPEAIIPLKGQILREVIAPVFDEIPALKEIVQILTDIRKAITGTIKVSAEDAGAPSGGGMQALAGSGEGADFGAAVGVVGFGR